jgi:hypothetical protein
MGLFSCLAAPPHAAAALQDLERATAAATQAAARAKAAAEAEQRRAGALEQELRVRERALEEQAAAQRVQAELIEALQARLADSGAAAAKTAPAANGVGADMAGGASTAGGSAAPPRAASGPLRGVLVPELPAGVVAAAVAALSPPRHSPVSDTEAPVAEVQITGGGVAAVAARFGEVKAPAAKALADANAALPPEAPAQISASSPPLPPQPAAAADGEAGPQPDASEPAGMAAPAPAARSLGGAPAARASRSPSPGGKQPRVTGPSRIPGGLSTDALKAALERVRRGRLRACPYTLSCCGCAGARARRWDAAGIASPVW